MNLKMITPYKIKKGFRYLLHFGPKEFMNHLLDRLEPEEVPYGPWFESHKAAEADLAAQRKKGVPGGPMFSVIVPAYMTPEKYLTRMIESVKAQSYENWELVIADASDKPGEPGAKSVADVVRPFSARDRRIRYEKLVENKDIASNTNAAVALAEGSFLAFLDHDDIIAPDALYHFAAAAADGADMIYSDEDKIRGDEEEHFQPHFKPDFNLDLLRSNNYITHFLAVKKSLAGEDPFDPSMSGAQDYDFIFRMSEKAQKIVHIPRVLYHWRTHEASTADNPLAKQYAYEAGKRAIEGNLERTGTKGEVELLPDFGFYRVHYPVQGKPLVSIIIPNRDQADTLKACMEALEKTHYSYYEVLVVENGSREKKTVDYYKKLKEENPRVRFLRWKKPFNYSGINNYAASKAPREAARLRLRRGGCRRGRCAALLPQQHDSACRHRDRYRRRCGRDVRRPAARPVRLHAQGGDHAGSLGGHGSPHAGEAVGLRGGRRLYGGAGGRVQRCGLLPEADPGYGPSDRL